MDVEVHIKAIEVIDADDGSGKEVIVTADGFLYVDRLRVYSTEDIRVRMVEATKGPEAQGLGSVLTKSRMTVPAAPTTMVSRRRTTTAEKKETIPMTRAPRSSFGQPNHLLPEVDVSLVLGGGGGGGGRAGKEGGGGRAKAVREALLRLDQPCSLAISSSSSSSSSTVISLPRSLPVDCLGDPTFCRDYNVRFPLYTGAMAKGIASARLVVEAGKAGVLASLGAGGLSPPAIIECLDEIEAAARKHSSSSSSSSPFGSFPFAVNLIHSPFDFKLEARCVEIMLTRGVKVAECSAFTSLTPNIVRYRAAGLSEGSDGRVVIGNRIIFKVRFSSFLVFFFLHFLSFFLSHPIRFRCAPSTSIYTHHKYRSHERNWPSAHCDRPLPRCFRNWSIRV